VEWLKVKALSLCPNTEKKKKQPKKTKNKETSYSNRIPGGKFKGNEQKLYLKLLNYVKYLLF
jgi:hypothetical protein